MQHMYVFIGASKGTFASLGKSDAAKMSNHRDPSHHDFPFHKFNSGYCEPMDILPLPPDDGLPIKINTYEDVPEEPRFDPKIHLNLKRPNYVRLFPNFEKVPRTPRVCSYRGSQFAWSCPFQVLSQEGVRVAKEIVLRNLHLAVGPGDARGLRWSLRGAYYLSPWIRDFQNCQELLNFFNEFIGEPIVPHCMFSNVPQVNVTIPEITMNTTSPVDPWHYDSVAYTGVILLNDMEALDGGDLELMKMNKHKALKALEAGSIRPGLDTEIISYENPGKMILAQGGDVLHHVTPLKSNHQRISMIIAYGPANCYQPTKSILSTMRMTDTVHNMGDYEFFREKAWQCGAALKGYTKNIKYTNDGKHLARYLRLVSEELNRAANLLDDSEDDAIDFYDELNKKITTSVQDFGRSAVKNGHIKASHG